MGYRTRIAWTDSTWNPWRGCRMVSPGCAHCYMFREQRRYGRDPSVIVRASSNTFGKPREWRVPRLVFTCSWSDFFIQEADAWRDEAWAVIRQTPQHTYQILTKRPERIATHLPPDWGHDGYPNVWLGVSGETLLHAVGRGRTLSGIPCSIRFLSAEPWLEKEPRNELSEVPAYRAMVSMFGWVILGGESGPDCRPFNLTSARMVRQACMTMGVPFFLKQLGGHPNARAHSLATLDGLTHTGMPEVPA